MTEKSNITRILQFENIVVERDKYNYTVSELHEAKKGQQAGELVQRNQSYHPSLNHALLNVRERVRAQEYNQMEGDSVDSLIKAVNDADEKMSYALSILMDCLDEKNGENVVVI